MTHLTLNHPVENFTFMTTESDTPLSFADFKGKNIILYFYPKDNTPGCTIESKDFRDLHDKFVALDTVVLGISRDTLKSHNNFKCKYTLPFPLISDPEQVLCHYFEVMKEKSMFGKKVHGIERSTFLIDKNGVLKKEWRKVSVLGHAKKVLEEVKALNN